MIEVYKVKVIDRFAKQTTGDVRVETWDKASRTKRAAKCLGMCWAGAVVAIPFPIVHLVLVPGLFLGGIAGSIYMSGQKSIVLGGEGTCPTCAERLEIVRGSDVWPLSDMCAKCQSMVTIEKI